jgi:hypothetical protein
VRTQKQRPDTTLWPTRVQVDRTRAHEVQPGSEWLVIFTLMAGRVLGIRSDLDDSTTFFRLSAGGAQSQFSLKELTHAQAYDSPQTQSRQYR